MKTISQAMLPAVCVGLLLVMGDVQSTWAETPRLSADSLLKEKLAEGLGLPPYRMEVWVESIHGLRQEGTKTSLESCLREGLRALGDVEAFKVGETEKPPAILRLRVWFTQTERPDQYECFDTTIMVVIGKIDKDNPEYEAVLDTYALAGVADRDLNDMCNKILTRFDLRILSSLRKRFPKTP